MSSVKWWPFCPAGDCSNDPIQRRYVTPTSYGVNAHSSHLAITLPLRTPVLSMAITYHTNRYDFVIEYDMTPRQSVEIMKAIGTFLSQDAAHACWGILGTQEDDHRGHEIYGYVVCSKVIGIFCFYQDSSWRLYLDFQSACHLVPCISIMHIWVL